MKLLIVPNALRDAIDKALDDAYSKCPEAPADERESHRQFLLNYFDEHGCIPEFELKKTEEGAAV